jgi:hypothetical protein
MMFGHSLMAQCPSCIRLWESSKPVGIFLLSGMRNMSIRHKYDLAREEGYLLWEEIRNVFNTHQYGLSCEQRFVGK